MKRFFTVLTLSILVIVQLLQPQRAEAVMDCPPNSLTTAHVTIPATLTRDAPSGIRIQNAPAEYYNERIYLMFIPVPEPTPDPNNISVGVIPVWVDIDATGNADLSAQTPQDLLPSIKEGTYRIELQGMGSVQNSDGSFGTVYPVCFSSGSTVTVTGGTACLPLGAVCDPSSTTEVYCQGAAVCNTLRDPPQVAMPDITNIVLNGAKCEYLDTSGNTTCGGANSSLSFACGSEIMNRTQTTMCCASALECEKAKGLAAPAKPFYLCEQAGPIYSNRCNECYNMDGVWTAVGCIQYKNYVETTRILVTIGLGLSGAVVVVMTLAGGFLITVSKGDPTKVDEAKTLITSAVMGILFLIFSVSILRFIGVTILQIPSFG